MANIHFISDPHFSHAGVCKFTREDGSKLRPFETPEEMDEVMIANWNRVVRPQDKIYCLGDCAMRKPQLEIFKKLNGHKRLLRGNHDVYRTADYMEHFGEIIDDITTADYLEYFEEIANMRVLDDMILSHIPLHPDCVTKRYKINVHGHLHANIIKDRNGIIDGKYLNICVEHTNYTPISLDELRNRIKEHQDLYPPVYTFDRQKGAD